MVVADSRVIYLHIFQERLSCIGNGLQEGALQTTNKDYQSICSDSQTCCNVVESNLSDSGLWGHFVVDHWAWEMSLFILCAPGNFHFHWLLFISRTEDVMLLSGVELDHIKWY
jgi:hypothetical protein